MHRLLAAALAIGLSTNGYAALEFSGYMRLNDGLQFVVTDPDSKSASGWITLGAVFEGHKVAAFDEREEVLILERGGNSIRLSLKDAHVRDDKVALPEKIEVWLTITSSGELIIDHQVVSLAAFDRLLRKYAGGGAPLALHYLASDFSPKVMETLEAVIRAVPKSGVKKYSLNIVQPPQSKG